MGHYYSEMRSEADFQREQAEAENKNKLLNDGVLALKEVFGDKAAAVAFAIHTIASPFNDTNASRFADRFQSQAKQAEQALKPKS